jgi:hypothetical protein
VPARGHHGAQALQMLLDVVEAPAAHGRRSLKLR